MIIAAVFWLLTLVVVALFVGRAWPAVPAQRVFAVRSRDQVVRSGIDAVVALALVRALFPPPVWASWLWVAAVVAVGVGVAGLITSWRRLTPRPRRWPTAVYLLIGAGLVAVLA